MPYETWMKANAPAYMQDQYGQAWMGGIGAALDDYVQQYISGTLAAFPDYAPSDALGVVGDELGLDRGPNETDLSYAARLRAAWIYWKLAGTPVGLLTALHFAGFPGAVILQQNGLAYNLSSDPTPGVDPTPLLVITPTAQLAVALTPVSPGTKTIPTGNSWWTFDSDTDLCSRFAILFPLPMRVPPTSWYTTGRATFAASSTASLVWTNQFQDTTYLMVPGAAVVTDGSSGPEAWVDGTSKTTTGVNVVASGNFTGYVDVLAFQQGANPFADLHAPDLARLQSAIKKWRPAKAICVGVYVCSMGSGVYGWPVATWGTRTTTGPTIVSVYPGA